ncbi:TPA: tRNA (adenosine(37)-N6)-threonylcarbamoyltransferase complex transferase subunit TsaD, partial [Campylobacter jejuni]|nr:tRNA (adenosine(37)-N6)-threonylcarbamoyltransferase complex transferase subunit TsaD [Campylobacter jejuni]
NAVRLEILKHENLNEDTKAEIAYAFENTACDHIMDKLEKIFNLYKFKNFGVVGGASANLNLRSRLQNLCQKYNANLKLAPLKFCSDNALMIARAAVDAYEKKEFVSVEEDILSPKNKNFSRI